MKKLFVNTLYVFGLLSGLLLFSCESSMGEESMAPAELRLSFNPISEDANGRTTSGNPSAIHVSIKNDAGESVHNLTELTLINFDGAYVTESITLSPGKYRITEFIVTDDDENAIYMSPKANSELAYLVSDPLDVEFRVAANDNITISPEVLSTATYTPEDFGYASFGFTIVESFDILVAAAVWNRGWVLTEAVITIKGDGDQIFSSNLAATTNQLTINDGYEEYEVIIEKDGYEEFEREYSASEIKRFFQNPLYVVLWKD